MMYQEITCAIFHVQIQIGNNWMETVLVDDGDCNGLYILWEGLFSSAATADQLKIQCYDVLFCLWVFWKKKKSSVGGDSWINQQHEAGAFPVCHRCVHDVWYLLSWQEAQRSMWRTVENKNVFRMWLSGVLLSRAVDVGCWMPVTLCCDAMM